MIDKKKLTNEIGAPVADNENSITAGPRGPVMMEDVCLMEKMARFNREVIPEQRMHAKGWGALRIIQALMLDDCRVLELSRPNNDELNKAAMQPCV